MAGGGAGPVQDLLSDTFDAILEAAKSSARPHFARLMRRVHFRAMGYAFALMAVIWAAIALTLAAAEHLPLWASFLGVSGALAVGAAGAFIFPSPESGNRISGRANHLEGE